MSTETEMRRLLDSINYERRKSDLPELSAKRVAPFPTWRLVLDADDAPYEVLIEGTSLEINAYLMGFVRGMQ